MVEQPRRIVSFVRRQGRMTDSQQRALRDLWPRYGIEDAQGLLDFPALFSREAPVVLEIGFGMGDSLARLAAAHPENDYLGIEVHRPGVGGLMIQLDKAACDNVRIICADAVGVLTNNIPDASLSGIMLFFPDPWPKKRHHKRRIVQPAIIELLGRKLKAGGVLHMATDWEAYATHMMDVMNAAKEFNNLAGQGRYSPRPESRPETKFERRGRRLGHEVWDLLFERI